MALGLVGPSAGAQADAGLQESAELFSGSCAACHLPPDPALPTDAAWLNQIQDTA